MADAPTYAAPHIKPKNKGKLHRALGVSIHEPIPIARIMKAKKSKSPALRKEATFAENAKHWNHG